MPITATDLITPTGALTVELLVAVQPGAADATASAALYAVAGVAKTVAWTDAGRADAGAIAWATYRALSDRAQQILTDAASVSAGDVAQSYQSAAQAKELRGLAAGWLDAYEAVAAEEAAAGTTPEPGTLPPISASRPFVVSW